MKTFTRKEFIDMYNKYDTRTLAEICECSVPTLYNRLKELGIPKKGRGKGQRQRKILVIEDL